MDVRWAIPIGILAIIAVSGCTSSITNEQNYTQNTTNQVYGVVDKTPSELILQASDFPTSEWTLKEKAERVKSEISEEALGLGWLGGYYALYYRIGSPVDISVLEHRLSVYPLVNVSFGLSNSRDFWFNFSLTNQSIRFDDLSDPNIGTNSLAYRIRYDENGTEKSVYIIEFTSKNVYEYLELRGLTLDYELLKRLAVVAESKVTGEYKPTPKQTLNGTVSGVMKGDYDIQETVFLTGILTGDVNVKANGIFYLTGILNGNANVEPHGTLFGFGTVNGYITNDGGLVNITGIVNGKVTTIAGSTFIDPKAIVRGY